MPEREHWQVAGTAAETYQRELVPAVFESWASRVVESRLCGLEHAFSTSRAGPELSRGWRQRRSVPLGASRPWT